MVPAFWNDIAPEISKVPTLMTFKVLLKTWLLSQDMGQRLSSLGSFFPIIIVCVCVCACVFKSWPKLLGVRQYIKQINKTQKLAQKIYICSIFYNISNYCIAKKKDLFSSFNQSSISGCYFQPVFLLFWYNDESISTLNLCKGFTTD